MVKLLCGALGVIALAACTKSPSLDLGGGYALLLADSVTHGGSDLKAVKYVDTATVLLGSSLTSGSSSSSSSTGSGSVQCTATVAQGQTANGSKALEIVLSCPSGT